MGFLWESAAQKGLALTKYQVCRLWAGTVNRGEVIKQELCLGVAPVLPKCRPSYEGGAALERRLSATGMKHQPGRA